MATTGVSTLFVDTNVLVFATRPASPWHSQALISLNSARQRSIKLVVSPRIMREYLAAVTRPEPNGQVTALPDALANVRTFLAEFRLVDETAVVVDALANLLIQIPASGRQVHDANIVATMLAHGIDHILTHNVNDFARYSRFITIVPLEQA